MYLLDTNVLSELMRPGPATVVVAWLDAQAADHLWISAITQAEIELGIALLRSGKRRNTLAAQAKLMIELDFAGRCLAFDGNAAARYAEIVASRTQRGAPISVEDAQIASIAVAQDKILVTRNTADFDEIVGLKLINPWIAG